MNLIALLEEVRTRTVQAMPILGGIDYLERLDAAIAELRNAKPVATLTVKGARESWEYELHSLPRDGSYKLYLAPVAPVERPIRYMHAEVSSGECLVAQASGLGRIGDCISVWVNEGDLYRHAPELLPRPAAPTNAPVEPKPRVGIDVTADGVYVTVALGYEVIYHQMHPLPTNPVSDDARDTKRLDWFLLDCDFDGINGWDLREATYIAAPNTPTPEELDAAYLSVCRQAIDAAMRGKDSA